MLRGCIRDAERCLTGAEVEGLWGKCIGVHIYALYIQVFDKGKSS